LVMNKSAVRFRPVAPVFLFLNRLIKLKSGNLIPLFYYLLF